MILCGICGTLCIFQFNVNIIMSHTHSSCRPTLDRASNKWTIYLSNDCRFIHRNPPIPKQRHRSTLCVHCRNSQIKHTRQMCQLVCLTMSVFSRVVYLLLVLLFWRCHFIDQNLCKNFSSSSLMWFDLEIFRQYIYKWNWFDWFFFFFRLHTELVVKWE